MIKNSIQNFSVGSLLVAARCRAGRERSPRDPCGPCWGGEGGHWAQLCWSCQPSKSCAQCCTRAVLRKDSLSYFESRAGKNKHPLKITSALIMSDPGACHCSAACSQGRSQRSGGQPQEIIIRFWMMLILEKSIIWDDDAFLVKSQQLSKTGWLLAGLGKQIWREAAVITLRSNLSQKGVALGRYLYRHRIPFKSIYQIHRTKTTSVSWGWN